jgi:hypothetical protein
MSLKRYGALLARAAAWLPLVATTVVTAAPAPPTLAAAPSCQFLGPSGAPSPIKHVVHVQFDNVHFTRDDPNVPSDLEQMPHLLDFIERNGTLLANEHTPLIAHTANNLLTGLTGVYGDQHGIPISNSFEYYNDSSLGSYNTSAFTYWTDTVAPDPANPARTLPYQMLDGSGKNLQAPWVPFVRAGCNFGAVSTVNMVLENNGNDVAQVFGPGSPETLESPADKTNDFVGIAVHCADATCSTVGNGSGAHAKPELGGQGLAALYGHKYVASQVSPITMTDGTPITGFKGFDPSPSYTLGYLASLLQANVPVVYGYIADAHDSRNACAPTSPSNPVVSDTNNGKPCGAYAPGEPGYVQQLKDWDTGFDQFFQTLDKLGINTSNTLFMFHADENDHYAGSKPLNPGCDGVHTPCQYDRTRLGEVTTDLPLLLKQQGLYDFGMIGGSGATPGTTRTGFTNADLAYAIDSDTAPGFWLKGHPAHGSAAVRKLEAGLAKVTSPNPYTNKSEPLFRFLIDEPGMKALHMISADPDRTAGIVGFGAEDHFIQTGALISATNTSTCNRYPAASDAACLSNGFIWLHGNFEPDVNDTWAGLVGPGVRHRGVDRDTWADHTDLRPTLMTLVCLEDGYAHEGRALLEELDNSALPESVVDQRDRLTELGRAFKQLNAPVGAFGRAAIGLSTVAIKSNDATYARLNDDLGRLTGRRDELATQIEAQLGTVPGCGGPGPKGHGQGDIGRGRRGPAFDVGALARLSAQAREVTEQLQRRADEAARPGR